MNAMQLVIGLLFFGGIGALALAAWLNRPWDLDGGEYRDKDGHRLGRLSERR